MAWEKGGQSTASFAGRLWMYSVAPVSVTRIDADGRFVLSASDGSYQISFLDITDGQRTLRDLAVTLACVGLAMLAVIFFVSLYFANRSIRPVSAAWEKQKQFVADASHELKTPLSIVTANYDVLLANQDETIRSQREWLDYMKVGTDRMTKLINSLLLLAKMEGGGVEASRESFDMSETISRDIDSMEAAAGRGLSISRSIAPGIVVRSDREMIRQIFAILLENAIRYAEENGKIAVSLEKSGHGVICSVKNSGRGIAKEDLPRTFDRFYRADKSRAGEGGGFELGLSIARAILQRLGGDIAADSRENEWTTFAFTLSDGM